MNNVFESYVNSYRGLSKEVWYLALITLINRAGTMVIPFLALYLTARQDFTYGQVGWVMTAFGSGAMAGAWLGGKLTDLFGYYLVMISSLIMTGIIFIALQFVNGFWPFCFSIFILMVVADSFRPAGLVALTAYSKPKNRTRSVTLIRLAINLGFSLGPALGGWIILSAGYSGLFWIDGLTCLCAAVMILLLLNPRKVVEQKQDDIVEVTQANSPYKDRPYWLLLLVAFLMGFAFMQLFSTLPLYYRESHGLNEGVIGWLMALNGMVIVFLEMPLVSYFENSKWSRVKVVQFSCVMMGLSYLLLNISPLFGMLVASMILISIGEMLGFPFTNAIAMNRAPKNKSGEYLALYTMSFAGAHIVGPNIGLQMSEHFDFETTWYFMAGIAFLAAILCMRLARVIRSK